MKSLQFLIILVSVIGIIGCDIDSSEGRNNLGVDTYIELLKSNQYDSLNLPAFTYKDIPALLDYRNETQIISNFPHNPISSFYSPNFKLGKK